MSLVLKNGRVVDPANGIDEMRDIFVAGSRIAAAGDSRAAETIDCAGKLVVPGLIDMHVHLREPGREDEETVGSGTRAALRGGITTVLAMANTQPAIDEPQHVRLVSGIIKRTAKANVLICGAITRKRLGKELADIARLKKEGVCALSDDGSSVESEEILRKALRKAKELRLPLLCHCEDSALANGGVMNLGFVSTRLGLRGIPAESEYRRVERDILLAEKERAAVHICHVSCAESVDAIARAKKRGVRVTCETAPHYFTLTEDDLTEYDTRLKVNPPLRSQGDREAVRQGLVRGVIDCIASDHAPHTIGEKDIEFDRAEFGAIGLETELAVSATELVRTGLLDWPELVRKLSLNPGRILGIAGGTLSEGAPANITVIDPDWEWSLKKEELCSKSRNSPFFGFRLKGRAECTIVNGAVAYRAKK